MKKTLLTLGIAMASYCSYAQNAPLYIWGTGLDGSTYQTAAIYSDAANGLLIEAPLNSAGAKLPIYLSWRGGGSPFPFMITPSGNIGIGTISPAQSLSVNGNTLIQNGSATSKGYLFSSPAANWGPQLSGLYFTPRDGVDATTDFSIKLWNGTAGPQWATSATRFFIDAASGNVGVGNSSPGNLLTVGSSTTRGTLNIIGSTTDAPGITLSDSRTSAHQYTLYNGVSNVGNLDIYDQAAGSYRFTINSAGNVGIGTTMPDTRLAVAGTIHATEVKVDLNVPGPDYVFNDDYKLITLTEIKAYVTQNHHLPEIPSAAQMAKDGINLGDMNTKLLKKVEELTLYAIDQEVRIAALEKALAKLTAGK